MRHCYLEGYLADSESVYRIPLKRFPALVGRDANLDVTLQSNNVSRQHARFLQQDGQLLVEDLGSTNGTFVNHLPVDGSIQLHPGDVIRFADVELRLLQDRDVPMDTVFEKTITTFLTPDEAVNRMPVGARHFEQLLQERMIKPLFQPIVSADEDRIVGLELLCRGCHPSLSELPLPLFSLAEALGQGIDLSETIRDIGVQIWTDSIFSGLPLYVNTHPAELKNAERLLGSLHLLRDSYPNGPLVLEIHEQAVTSQASLYRMTQVLKELQIGLAYDDFGAGQARLLEVLDVPPYAVKFDISLVRDLDKASPKRQDMISLLVKMVKKGQTYALAEGVSNHDELSACKRLGFDLIQGFVYDRPATLDQLALSPYWHTAG